MVTEKQIEYFIEGKNVIVNVFDLTCNFTQYYPLIGFIE